MAAPAEMKQLHLQKQKELMDQVNELEAMMKREEDEAKASVLAVEKKVIAMEMEMKEMESAAQEELREQLVERKALAAKQLKQLELSDKLISELKKENLKLRKAQQKVMDKYKEIDETSQKIGDMNSSLSNMHDSISNMHELVETKYATLEEHREAVKKENALIKEQVRKEQDNYWEVAQSRLEYQKGMAKILTMVQDQTNNSGNSEAYVNLVTELTQIALQTENEAKTEFAQLEIETAAAEYDSPTGIAAVEEKFDGDNSDQYLQISLVPQRP